MNLRLGFAGTPDFAAQHLAALIDSDHDIAVVLSQPDRPAGRGKKSRLGPVSSLAHAHGLPLLQPHSLRDVTAQEALASRALDALIVVAYGLILPQAVLEMPRFGCINVHGSLLPRWRGAAPIQRAIEAGDPQTGVTIMKMDAGLDTGPMLKTQACTINRSTTSGDLYAQLAKLGPRALLEVLQDLPGHLEAAQAQKNENASYAAKITKDEARLDWRCDAADLMRKIHAFNPAPGCFSELAGERVKVWRAEAVADPHSAPPGTLLPHQANHIAVACGEGKLVLTYLQLPGAKAMSAADILRGHHELFAPGRQFASATAERTPS